MCSRYFSYVVNELNYGFMSMLRSSCSAMSLLHASSRFRSAPADPSQPDPTSRVLPPRALSPYASRTTSQLRVLDLQHINSLTPHNSTHSVQCYRVGIDMSLRDGDWLQIAVVVLLSLCFLVATFIAVILLLLLRELRSRPPVTTTPVYFSEEVENQCLMSSKTSCKQISQSGCLSSSILNFSVSKLGSMFPPPWLTNGTVMMVDGTGKTSDAKEPSETEDNDTDITTEASGTECHLKPTKNVKSSRQVTPAKRLNRRLSNVSWENAETGDEAASESSCSSSQTKTKVNGRNTVWIKEDGEIFLDKGNSCKLSYMSDYIGTDSAANLCAELSTTVGKLCTPSNKDNLQIVLKPGVESKLTDIDPKKGTKKHKKTATPKMSVLSVNLDDPSELCSLVKCYQDRLNKTVKDVFQLDVQFDKTTIYHMNDPSHNIPYCNTSQDNSNFSPAVAVLALGLKEPRPMFIKTQAGSQVTHKVALMSGTLCVLSGNTELRYKRSIPKGWGKEGEQYFLVFEQKTPTETDSTFNVLQKKPQPDITLEQAEDVICKETLPLLKTPPTVVRVTSAAESLDYEANGGLLLASTISAVVGKMDEETVDKELIRSQVSTTGSLSEKRTRLQHKMCMSIGEFSISAANNSMSHGMNFSRCDSPRIEDGGMRDDITSVRNAQKCVENSLKHVVDSIVSVKANVATLQELTKIQTQKDISPCLTSNTEVLDAIKDLKRAVSDCNNRIDNMSKTTVFTHTIKECNGKIDDLVENVNATKDDLQSMRKILDDLSQNGVDIMKKSAEDMGSYYNSVFCDETREQIKDIHAYVSVSPQVCEVAIQTDPLIKEITAIGDQANLGSPSPKFKFPDRLQSSLKVLVESAQPISIWLVTDSIMRHIDESCLEFRKYRTKFERIDVTCSKSLIGENMGNRLSSEKPQLIYVHLGINDIHNGENIPKIVDNFKIFDEMVELLSPNTRLVISCPLLNGNTYQNRHVFDLRRSLSLLVNQQQNEDPNTKRISLQRNDKFFTNTMSTPKQNSIYFRDNLHLSDRGMHAITSTMRDTLDKIFREFELPV